MSGQIDDQVDDQVDDPVVVVTDDDLASKSKHCLLEPDPGACKIEVIFRTNFASQKY